MVKLKLQGFQAKHGKILADLPFKCYFIEVSPHN